MSERIELQAIRIAKSYFEDQGYSVKDVSRVRGHNGYDLVVTRGNELQKVEVKGCSREWQIPDLFSTEFDENRRLVADLLCVVYVTSGGPPSGMCVIPRHAVLPEYVKPKSGFRISSRFKKKATLEQFHVTLPPAEDA